MDSDDVAIKINLNPHLKEFILIENTMKHHMKNKQILLHKN